MILLFIAFVSIFIALAYMRFEASSVKVKEVFFTKISTT